MNAPTTLLKIMIDLQGSMETSEFEYEGIFEEREGETTLISPFTLLYKGQVLFAVEKEEVLSLESSAVMYWLKEKASSSMKTDVFILLSLESDVEKLLFQKRMKDERKQRNEDSIFYEKRLEKQVNKELKEIVKKIEEKKRRILELKRYSPYVEAIFLLRDRMM